MGNAERKIMHKVLDLFSGIGGFSLGLERTGGFETVAFCEIDKYCQKVLRKHWASVPIYNDIKELTNERLRKDGINPTVICGGFPCQDISVANTKAKGLDGERSGLFFEIIRLVRNIRPEYVILENVSALLGRGLGNILGEFSEVGFDAEWHCISASSVGAPHKRDRIWIMANPSCSQRTRNGKPIGLSSEQPTSNLRGHSRKAISIMDKTRLEKTNWWKNEPRLLTLDDGIPDRVARLKAIGNSLIPQIPEMIGNAILEHEKTD